MTDQEHLTTSDLAEARRITTEPATAPPSDQAAPPPGTTTAPLEGAADGPRTSRSEPNGDVQADPSPESGTSPLFDQADYNRFQERWKAIQIGFVDAPRQSVEQADTLVAETMTRLAETFAQERGALESQWEEASDVSTEDLRVALKRYRSFFERLLAV
jgi:hypothetical protein